MKKTAILFTANSPQIPTSHVFLDSLLDPNKGNYKGDVWVLSTNLNNAAKQYLNNRNIHFFINPLNEVNELKDWKKIAVYQPLYKKLQTKNIPEEERLKQSFDSYKNKRLSKLILLYWCEFFGKQYDQIILCDNDLLVQKDMNLFFEKYESKLNQILFTREVYNSLPNTTIWKQNLAYKKYEGPTPSLYDAKEINIGLLLGTPQSLYWLFSEIKAEYKRIKLDLILKEGWQDQSLTRLIYEYNKDKFDEFEYGDIVHLSNGGRHTVFENRTLEFEEIHSKSKPFVIHFAASKQKYFPPLSFSTSVNENDFFYFYNTIYKRKEENNYNIWDFLNFPNAYVTAENINWRIQQRKKWATYKKNSKKPTLLYATWLKVGTHSDNYLKFKDFLVNSYFDTVIISSPYSGVVDNNVLLEFLPEVVAKDGNFIRSSFLADLYGYKFSNIPYNCIEEGALTYQREWNCSFEIALAISNIAFLYFYDALSFYQPNIVGLLAFASSHKILKKVCDLLHIKTFYAEYGVLDGTFAVDFYGSMGKSWVSIDSANFNKLPITSEDLDYAKQYCNKIIGGNYSRNSPKNLSSYELEKLKLIKKEYKHIILFAGSNDSNSGHFPYNKENKNIHSPFFENDQEIIDYLVKFAEKQKDIFVIYRPHPISKLRSKIGTSNSMCFDEFDSGNLVDILKFVDLCVVNVSQSNYVSLVNNVPVFMVGKNQINSSGSVYELSSKENFEFDLSSALQSGYTQTQKDNFFSHVSRLLKYYLFELKESPYNRTISELPNLLSQIVNNSYDSLSEVEKTFLSKDHTSSKLEDDLVSVIVPIRNNEDIMFKSINSLLGQTYRNLEIILVVNDSFDSSLLIAEYYGEKDSRIKVINSEISGASRARNIGIKEATGKYLLMLDSDDSLDYYAIEELVKKANSTNSDCLYFLYRENFVPSNEFKAFPRWTYLLKFLDVKNDLVEITEDNFIYFLQCPFTPLRFYKKDYFITNNLFFNEDCLVFEDNVNNVQTLISKGKLYLYCKMLYNYSNRRASLVHKRSKSFMTGLLAIEYIDNILMNSSLYLKALPLYSKYKCHLVDYAYNQTPLKYREEFVEKLKLIITDLDLGYAKKEKYDSIAVLDYKKAVTVVNALVKGDIASLVQQQKKSITMKVIKSYIWKKIKNIFKKQ